MCPPITSFVRSGQQKIQRLWDRLIASGIAGKGSLRFRRLSLEIKHRVKWLVDCQANEAAMELAAEAPDREESPFQLEEFFIGPPFQLGDAR
jgi:hypothetical protein